LADHRRGCDETCDGVERGGALSHAANLRGQLLGRALGCPPRGLWDRGYPGPKKGVMDTQMARQMGEKDGFIAALDQSGGSTPGALRRYGSRRRPIKTTPRCSG
jgi:hypothetical protein